MTGDVLLKLLAPLDCRLARSFDGGHDLLAQPSQLLLVAEQGEPIAVSVILTPKLAQQFISTLQVVLGESGIVVPVEIGNRILGGSG
jgi:hypothetical protein